jgi:hypothetical protein
MTKINETILRVVQDEDGDINVLHEDGAKELEGEDYTVAVAQTLRLIAFEPQFPNMIKQALERLQQEDEDAE